MPASDVSAWAKAASKPSYTKSEVGLGNVGNFLAVSTEASQGLSETQKTNARSNIGAGTSSFSGSYNDLTDKPTIPSVGNAEIEIQKNGTKVGSFTTNQSGSKVAVNITVPTGTAANKDVPTSGNASSTQVVMGNDSRLTDSRNAKDVYDWAKASTKPTYIASEVGAIPTSAKGAAFGVAELDTTGKVPTSQLPSYVDDVLEYANKASFPATGETGKIYVDKATNLTWRWGGSAYVEISPSLALGETSSTAYAGDKGKALADKLATIAEGAEVNVQSDWNATSGDAFIKNKPTTVSGYGITDAYTKNQTYTKTEVNGLVDTPHQKYVTVDAYASLPATGSKDTIYRVSNYNGSTSQVDASVYSEYAWNGRQYVFLCVKSQIGEVFDISVYNNNAKYADLAAALNGGANIPQSLQKGGMSVKFVQSSDNKYVQFRCMAQNFTTDVTQWQGVDDMPILDSDNLPTSNGVILSAIQYYEPIKEQIILSYGTITGATYSPAFNKLHLGCEYLLIQTFGTKNVRICLNIWNANGDLLKSVTFGDCIYDTAKGIYYKTIKVPSGAYAYLACYDRAYTGDVTNMFVIQYLKKENAELPPLEKVWSSNLLDASSVIDGIINTDGSISSSPYYITTGFIPVEKNTIYNIKNNAWANVNSRRIVQYNVFGEIIANSSIDNVSSVTTNASCYYIRLSIEKRNFDSIENVGVFKNDINTFSYYGYNLDVEENLEYGSKNNNSIITKKDLEEQLLKQKEYINNKVEPYQFLNDSFEKLVSENLLNGDYFLENTLVDTNNNASPSSTYSSYKDLPISAGSFIIKNIDWEDVQVRMWSVRNAGGTRLAYGENASAITLPANSAVISLAFNNNEALSKPIGLFPSSAESYSGDFDEYVGIKLEASYNELPKSALVKKQDLEGVKSEILSNINNIEEEIQEIKESLSPEDVTLTVNNNEVNFSSRNTVLKCSKSSGVNGVFNFTQRTVGGVTSNMGDDVAPMHIAIKEGNSATTIGANHGWVYTAQATIQSHGKTNSSIGTLWTDSDNNIYVLAEIIDADTILFLPQNKGNRTDIDLYTPNMVAGTISSGSQTMTVTAVSHPQLHNSVTTHTLHIYDANGDEVANDGTYKSKFFDVVESYEIKNLADIISNLIARQSQSPIPTDEPVFTAQGMVKVTNVYRVFDNTSVLVSANIQPLQKIYLNDGDMMFSQSQYIVSGVATIQHYVPGSKPTSSYDLTKPVHVDWSAQGNPSFYANSQSQQDADKPINRVIQYYPTKYGFALGFLNYAGVGKSLLNNTNNTFELRGYSGKVYPHGVEGTKIGSVINVGDCFSAVMYRVNIDINTKTNERLSYYSIEAPDGYTYLFADYASDCIDKIVLGTKFNGKPIELVESNNCSLMSDVYNDEVLINATYTNNQTSYIILKIKS